MAFSISLETVGNGSAALTFLTRSPKRRTRGSESPSGTSHPRWRPRFSAGRTNDDSARPKGLAQPPWRAPQYWISLCSLIFQSGNFSEKKPIGYLFTGNYYRTYGGGPGWSFGLVVVNRALSRGPLRFVFRHGSRHRRRFGGGDHGARYDVSFRLFDRSSDVPSHSGRAFSLLSRRKDLPNQTGDTDTGGRRRWPGASLRNDFSFDRLESGDDSIFRCDLRRLGNQELERSLSGCSALSWRGFFRFSFVVVGP